MEKHSLYDCFWCPAFSTESWLTFSCLKTTAYYRYYYNYLFFLLFKGSCRTLAIYFRQNSY